MHLCSPPCAVPHSSECYYNHLSWSSSSCSFRLPASVLLPLAPRRLLVDLALLPHPIIPILPILLFMFFLFSLFFLLLIFIQLFPVLLPFLPFLHSIPYLPVIYVPPFSLPLLFCFLKRKTETNNKNIHLIFGLFSQFFLFLILFPFFRFLI